MAALFGVGAVAGTAAASEAAAGTAAAASMSAAAGTAATAAASTVSASSILSTVMTAASIAGSLVSAYGMLTASGAKAQQYSTAANSTLRQAAYSASVAEDNALTMEDNAKEARKTAAYNADVKRREANKAVADMELGYASSGVELTSGSPLEAMFETKKNYELDALNIIYEGDQQATEYERRSKFYKKSAQNTLMTGQESAQALEETGDAVYDAGRISTVGTILTGTKKLASAYKGTTTLEDLYA